MDERGTHRRAEEATTRFHMAGVCVQIAASGSLKQATFLCRVRQERSKQHKEQAATEAHVKTTMISAMS